MKQNGRRHTSCTRCGKKFGRGTRATSYETGVCYFCAIRCPGCGKKFKNDRHKGPEKCWRCRGNHGPYQKHDHTMILELVRAGEPYSDITERTGCPNATIAWIACKNGIRRHAPRRDAGVPKREALAITRAVKAWLAAEEWRACAEGRKAGKAGEFKQAKAYDYLDAIAENNRHFQQLADQVADIAAQGRKRNGPIHNRKPQGKGT